MDSILREEPGKQHPVLDYERYEELYRKKPRKKPDGEIIGSPFDIYAVETIRKRLGFEDHPSLSTDVFVWAEGEPEKPYLTKIGGLPYLPKEVSWPLDSTGQPCIFMAQICFVDSKDIMSIPMPSDVLLIFVKHDAWDGEYLECYEPDHLYFQWVQITDKPTWDQQSMNENGIRSIEPTFFGVIHRMGDYQETTESNPVSGTKIGGFPAYIQEGLLPFEKQILGTATYIGQFVSLQFAANTPFPVCNRKKPFSDERESDDYAWGKGRCLMIGDSGSIYFFLKPDGTIYWLSECY